MAHFSLSWNMFRIYVHDAQNRITSGNSEFVSKQVWREMICLKPTCLRYFTEMAWKLQRIFCYEYVSTLNTFCPNIFSMIQKWTIKGSQHLIFFKVPAKCFFLQAILMKVAVPFYSLPYITIIIITTTYNDLSDLNIQIRIGPFIFYDLSHFS